MVQIGGQSISVYGVYGTNRRSIHRRSIHSVYGTNRRSIHTVCTVQIDGQPIQCVHKLNCLGTSIQETLNWTSHIDRISNKISQTLGVMNKLKHFLPGYTLKTMLHSIFNNSLIVPHFNYSGLSWGFDTNTLSKLQKGAIRIISRGKY